MEKEGGNRERMRKCRESISLHFLIFSPFPPHFLILSPFPRSPAARLQRFVQPWEAIKHVRRIVAKILFFWPPPLSWVRLSIERVLSCPNFIFMHLSQRHCAYLGKRNYWDSESPVSARTLPASQELHQDSDGGGEAKEASNPVLT